MSSAVPVLETLGSVLAGVAFFAFLPLELWRCHRRGRLTTDAVKEMAASCSPFVPTLLTSGLLVAYFALLFGAASRLAPWHIPTTPWTAAAAVLAVDFLYYWDHRASHRVRLLWAVAHSVHHSSPLYNQTVGLRITFLDGYLSLWFYVPLALLGFEPLLIAAAFGVILGYQQWLHTETIGRLGWLDGWINTPSAHRVHHGVQPEYLDRNFGAILLVWDRLFGTWQREDAPVRYGLTHPLGSSNPLTVHFYELGRLLRSLAQTRGLGRKLRLLFAPP